MSSHDSINRRQFLEKSSLIAAAATAVGVARPASAQLNNSAAVNLEAGAPRLHRRRHPRARS